MLSIEVLFWLSVTVVGYHYLIYPTLLYWLNRSSQKPISEADSGSIDDEENLPTLAVVLSAFQEEKHLNARIQNLLASDYPKDKLRVYVGSDGSTDDTNKIIQQYEHERQVKGVIFAENRGKPSVLNSLVSMTSEDILVFTDANTEFAPDNLKILAARFREPELGAVCGSLKLYSESPEEPHEDGLYWQYEQWLKANEAKLGGLIGLTGGNYAIRRSCYSPIPEDLLVDDLYAGLMCSLNNKQLAYDGNAKAFEEAIPDNREEYKRRVRIGRGNFQIMNLLLKRIWRAQNALTFTFISHKVFRWITPTLLLLIALTSLILSPLHWIFELAVIVQLCAYALALAVHFTEDRWTWPTWSRALYYLLYMNLALLHGLYQYLFSGSKRASWNRSAR